MRLGAALALVLLSAGVARGIEPEISSDVRIDLVGLLERLSGDPGAARNPVSDAAVEHFAPWAAHPAIVHLAGMRRGGFSGAVPAQYALYLTTSPVLREALPVPSFFVERAGGRAVLDAWLAELSDFVRASGFLEWERARAAAREEELASVRAASGGEDLGAPLTRLLGARPWSSWNAVVSPFFPPGGSAAWIVEETSGRPAVFTVYGPTWRSRGPGQPPHLAADEPVRFAECVLPEAAFVMAYAVYEVCRPVLRAAPNVCDVASSGSSEDCVHRHWVRSIVHRLLKDRWGRRAAKEHRKRWPGGSRQAQADAALDSYASDRVRYPDLMDARGILSAPFLEGHAPECRLVDRSRWQEQLYSRRLASYLDARLELRPDEELEAARRELAAARAEGRK